MGESLRLFVIVRNGEEEKQEFIRGHTRVGAFIIRWIGGVSRYYSFTTAWEFIRLMNHLVNYGKRRTRKPTICR